MGKDTNTITLETAQEWAKAWREQSDLKAFLIPKEDITQLLDDHPAEVANIRAYLGIDTTGMPKLMIVGVNAAGKDLINDKTDHYIYDFTLPCPNTCDGSSPLYNLP